MIRIGSLPIRTDPGQTRLLVRDEDKSVWLPQDQMVTLFQTLPQNITIHIRAEYSDGELTGEGTCKEVSLSPQEGR